MSIRLIIKDEVNIQFENLPLPTRKALSAAFKYDKPNAQFTPSCKLGRWDGKVTLFGIGGSGYLHQLERILLILKDHRLTISEIVDKRQPFHYACSPITASYWADQGKTWPEGHPLAGQPIVLYDYQVDIVNRFLEYPQSVQEVATGAGKCLSYHTPITIIHNNTSTIIPIGKFIRDIITTQLLHNADVNSPHPDYMIKTDNMIKKFMRDGVKTQLLPITEVNIAHLGYMINTPHGPATINHVIKKEGLSGLTVTLAQDIHIECATHHQFIQNGQTVLANSLHIGDLIDTINGPTPILDIQHNDITTFYDISIDAPHIYYDSRGIAHHNTITTATLAHVTEPYGRSIVVVPSTSLILQTEEDFITVGLDVGVYFGNRKDLHKKHTICTWQSLNVLHKKSIEDENAVITLKEFLRGVSTVIVDECHTVRADILRSLLTHNISNASIRWGLTGTIPKEAYEYESLFASVGPLIGGIAAHELQTQGYLSTCNVNVIQTIEFREFISFTQEIQYLSSNTQRMHHLAHLIDTISHTGNTLVLVNRINAGTLLKAEILKISGIDVPFIHGSVQVNARKEEYDDAKITNNKIILATYGVAALGINIPRLFNLVLVDPGKGFIRVIQSIGRGLRRAEDKNHVEIYDITSTLKYSKRHLTIRKRFYKDAHYPFNIKKLDWTTTT